MNNTSSTDNPLTADALTTLIASLRPPDQRVPVMHPSAFAAILVDVNPPTFGFAVQTNAHLRRGEIYLVPPESWKWLRDLAPRLQAETLRMASMMAGPDEAAIGEWAEIDPMSGVDR